MTVFVLFFNFLFFLVEALKQYGWVFKRVCTLACFLFFRRIFTHSRIYYCKMQSRNWIKYIDYVMNYSPFKCRKHKFLYIFFCPFCPYPTHTFAERFFLFFFLPSDFFFFPTLLRRRRYQITKVCSAMLLLFWRRQRWQ